MASRSTSEKWLVELASLPTASGVEDQVIGWVRSWAGRRSDLELVSDSGGNLLITQKGKKRRPYVLAVAHMDHPAFVVTDVAGNEASFEFRGGVRADYFPGAHIGFMTGRAKGGRVATYSAETRTGTIQVSGSAPSAGDIARWRFAPRRPTAGRVQAPAFDDLAGCAAAMSALDRARGNADLRHFGVLLTRAEEVGFIGALHAAKSGSIPSGARLLSIEASRASADAPIGAGPVIRVGDAATVFDHGLTNLISRAAGRSGIGHQRKLMAGGSCEATAFGAYGYRTTGLCLPLGNYHNMGNLDDVERGTGDARAMLEEIALSDFHGLVDLLLLAASALDEASDLPKRLDALYEEARHLLT